MVIGTEYKTWYISLVLLVSPMPDHGLHTDKVTPCGGHDNEHDGCQTTFRRSLKKNLLCKKCVVLQAPMSDMDKEHIMNLTQCKDCGIYGTRVTSPCGTCKAKTLEIEGLVDVDKMALSDDRAVQMAKRVRKDSFNASLSPKKNQLGATTNEKELDDIRSGLGKARWTIIYEIRIGGKLSPELGSASLTFTGSQTMQEVLQAAVAQISPQWTGCLNHMFDLHVDDCELQFRGKKLFKEQSHLFLSIQKFYDTYAKGADHAYFLTTTKEATRLTKGTFMCLEVFVNENKYLTRTSVDNEDSDGFLSLPLRSSKSQAGGARGGKRMTSERPSKKPREQVS
ncbi:hypothetical protein JB92DRAFT_2884773 [Gautieria morchelliformis]|nr:hypothetical protein JB92DRAFT_2884773 [Gautieria morchelliformis]